MLRSNDVGIWGTKYAMGLWATRVYQSKHPKLRPGENKNW